MRKFDERLVDEHELIGMRVIEAGVSASGFSFPPGILADVADAPAGSPMSQVG
jgi:hypothetical protein